MLSLEVLGKPTSPPSSAAVAGNPGSPLAVRSSPSPHHHMAFSMCLLSSNKDACHVGLGSTLTCVTHLDFQLHLQTQLFPNKITFTTPSGGLGLQHIF